MIASDTLRLLQTPRQVQTHRGRHGKNIVVSRVRSSLLKLLVFSL